MNFASVTQAHDADPEETAEWLGALESVVRAAGEERAEFILSALARKATELGVGGDVVPYSPYRNSIPRERQPRRNGRAGINRGVIARGARKARQFDLRHQLQPSAPRRAGARKRPNYSGVGEPFPRRGLERHQGPFGLRMGRTLRAR